MPVRARARLCCGFCCSPGYGSHPLAASRRQAARCAGRFLLASPLVAAMDRKATRPEPGSRGFSQPLLGQPFYGCKASRPLVVLPALGRSQQPSGAWGWGQKIGRPNGRSPLSGRSRALQPRHASLKFLTHAASTRSSCLHRLAWSSPCYSGPVRAPAFRERQTGAPRTGLSPPHGLRR